MVIDNTNKEYILRCEITAIKKIQRKKKKKTTALSIPAWSPTAVLTGPFHA